jgi:hypothetical protein
MRLVSLSRFGLSRIGLRAGLCGASAVIQRKMYRLDTGRSWAASRCVLLNRQRSHPQRLGCAWPLLSPEAARALVKRMRLPRRRPTMAKSSYPDLTEINYKPAHPVTGRSGALNARGSVPTGSLAGDGRYACSPGSGGPGWRRISGLASGAVLTSARGVRGKS